MAYNKSGQIPLDQLSDEQNALLNRLACADTGNMGKKHGQETWGRFMRFPEKQKEAKGWFLALFLANKNYPCASLEKITYKDKKKRAMEYE